MAGDVRSLNAQRDRGQRARDNQLLDTVERVQRDLSEPPTTAGQKQSNRKR